MGNCVTKAKECWNNDTTKTVREIITDASLIAAYNQIEKALNETPLRLERKEYILDMINAAMKYTDANIGNETAEQKQKMQQQAISKMIDIASRVADSEKVNIHTELSNAMSGSLASALTNTIVGVIDQALGIIEKISKGEEVSRTDLGESISDLLLTNTNLATAALIDGSDKVTPPQKEALSALVKASLKYADANMGNETLEAAKAMKKAALLDIVNVVYKFSDSEIGELKGLLTGIMPSNIASAITDSTLGLIQTSLNVISKVIKGEEVDKSEISEQISDIILENSQRVAEEEINKTSIKPELKVVAIRSIDKIIDIADAHIGKETDAETAAAKTKLVTDLKADLTESLKYGVGDIATMAQYIIHQINKAGPAAKIITDSLKTAMEGSGIMLFTSLEDFDEAAFLDVAKAEDTSPDAGSDDEAMVATMGGGGGSGRGVNEESKMPEFEGTFEDHAGIGAAGVLPTIVEV